MSVVAVGFEPYRNEWYYTLEADQGAKRAYLGVKFEENESVAQHQAETIYNLLRESDEGQMEIPAGLLLDQETDFRELIS